MEKYLVASLATPNGKINIYLINPGETWSRGRHEFRAHKTASLIYEEQYSFNYRVVEHDLRDPSVWTWAANLLQHGVDAINAAPALVS